MDTCLSPVQTRTLIQVAWVQPALTSSLHAEDFAEAVKKMIPSHLQSVEFMVRNVQVKDRSFNPRQPQQMRNLALIAK